MSPRASVSFMEMGVGGLISEVSFSSSVLWF